MKCFSRFCNEHNVSYGVYGFDRGFWTGKMTSLTIFRLGLFEYEMVEEEGIKKIEIHIPSDSKLTNINIEKSIKMSKEFFSRYFPEYSNVNYYCHSWLLSPILVEENMLPINSNIRIFVSYFKLIGYYDSYEPQKDIGGYLMLAYYYTSWKLAIPDGAEQLGLPYKKQYEDAQLLYKQKLKNTF